MLGINRRVVVRAAANPIATNGSRASWPPASSHRCVGAGGGFVHVLEERLLARGQAADEGADVRRALLVGLGAHLIGPDVTELLPELTLARLWEMTAEEVARNVHAHPSLSEALGEVAEGVLGHMIHL